MFITLDSTSKKLLCSLEQTLSQDDSLSRNLPEGPLSVRLHLARSPRVEVNALFLEAVDEKLLSRNLTKVLDQVTGFCHKYDLDWQLDSPDENYMFTLCHADGWTVTLENHEPLNAVRLAVAIAWAHIKSHAKDKVINFNEFRLVKSYKESVDTLS